MEYVVLSITALVLVVIWLIAEVVYLKNQISDIEAILQIGTCIFSGKTKSKLDTLLKAEDFIVYEQLSLKRFEKLEEYLGIKRLQKEEKVDKYVKIKK